MEDSTPQINPVRLSSRKLKSFFKHLSISAKKVEERKQLKAGIKKQIDKLKQASEAKGAVNKDDMQRAIERLEQKLDLVLEGKKFPKRKVEEKNVFDDIFQRIESLGAKVNAIGNLIEKSQSEKKKIDPERIYELEQKISKKLDKLSTSLRA